MDLYYRSTYDGEPCLVGLWDIIPSLEGWKLKECRVATMLEF